MSDRNSGKWLPFNLDGSLHSCRNQTQTGTKNVKTRPLSLEEIDARLKRVELIVIGPRK
jgi:hypothetical protein